MSTSPANAIPPEITPEQAKHAFQHHLVEKAIAARRRYGGAVDAVDADAIVAMLGDGETVRYPTTLIFDASPLQPHEFAYPQRIGFHASDGYALCVHPFFERQRASWPLLIAYHIPVINYGNVAEADDAELYGATLLGLDVEAYYDALCALADAMTAAAS